MGLSSETLDPPQDDIAFLARSNNRVTVLEKLAEDPRTRRELREETDVSRPTLGRVLDDFQERRWVRAKERGHEYALTPFGRLLAEEFGTLMETVETIQQLRDLAPRLPLEEMDFDLRLLVEATVTTPSPTDATAHTRREAEMLARTERVRFLCNQAQPETVERYREHVVERGRSLEAIITGDAIDAASADPEMAVHLREMLDSEGVQIYRYEGDVSLMMGLLDDMATIVPLDDAGVPCAFVESTNEEVRAWVSDRLATYREQAREVAIDTLSLG